MPRKSSTQSSLTLNLKDIKKFQLVQIKWNDIVSDNSGWAHNKKYNFKQHANASNYESVGYFINKDDKFIFLAMSVNIENDISGMMLAIPIGTIKELKTI